MEADPDTVSSLSFSQVKSHLAINSSVRKKDNTQDEFKANAILFASEYKNWEQMKYLLENGSQVDLTLIGPSGNTVFNQCALNGQWEIVTGIVEEGRAIVDLDIPLVDKSGAMSSVWKLTATEGRLDMCKELARSTYMRGERDHSTSPSTSTDSAKGGNGVPEGHTHESAVLSAITCGHFEIADFILASLKVSLPSASLSIALTNALQEGNERVMRYLVTKMCANVNTVDHKGRLPLALAHKSSSAMKFLLEEGKADPHSKDSEGKTALHHCAAHGSPDVVNMFLDHRVDVNGVDENGVTPLMEAASAGNILVVECLCTRFPNIVNAKDNKGRTAVSMAADANHWNVVEALVRKYQATTEGKCGPKLDHTVLCVAALYDPLTGSHLSISPVSAPPMLAPISEHASRSAPMKKFTSETLVRMLIEEGRADIEAQGASGNTVLLTAMLAKKRDVVRMLLSEFGSNVEATDRSGNSAVMIASKLNDRDMVSTLVDVYHADINRKNSRGHTALMVAVDDRNMDLVQFLVNQCKADVECTDSSGKTVLLRAGLQRDTDLVRWLVRECKADPEIQDENGRTPLITAAEGANFQLVKLLIEDANVNVNGTDKDGRTALMIACEPSSSFDWNLVRFLVVEGKANVNRTDANGRSCLMRVADYRIPSSERQTRMKNSLEVITFLVQQCHCNPHLLDMDGMTALGIAAKRNKPEIVEYLATQSDCEVDTPNDHGYTPLLTACMDGNLEMVELLYRLHAVRMSKVHNNRRSGSVAGSIIKQDIAGITGGNIVTGAGGKGRRRSSGGGATLSLYNQDGSTRVRMAPSTILPRTTLSVSADGDERSCLAHAAKAGHLSITKFLVEHTIFSLEHNLNMVDVHFKSAIDHAIQEGNFSVAKYLITVKKLHLQPDIVHQVSLVPVWTRNPSQLKEFYCAVIARSSSPILEALKCAQVCANLSTSVHHVSYVDDYNELQKMFTSSATTLLDALPNDHVAGWVLTQTNDNGSCPLTVALDSHNIAFMGSGRVHRVVNFWWSNTWKNGEYSSKYDSSPSQAGGGISHKRLDKGGKDVNDAFKETNFPVAYTTSEMVGNTLMAPFVFFRIPKVKFYLEVVCFLLFLLVFALVAFERNAIHDELTLTEIFLMVIGLSYIVNEVEEMIAVPDLKSYSRDEWKQLDIFISGCVFLIGVIRLSFAENDSEPSWYFDTIYSLAMVCCAIALSVRTLFIFTVHDSLGPLLLVLGKILKDVKNFVMLLLVFVVGFGIAFAFLLGGDASNGMDRVEGFQDVGDILKTLFHGMFGSVNLDRFSSENVHQVDNHNRLIGQVLVAIYIGLSAILLVNLLIAMMSHTYQTVRSQFTDEYIFSRLKTIWKYDQRRNRLPPPFNIIVVVLASFAYLFSFVSGLSKKKKNEADEVEERERERERERVSSLTNGHHHHKQGDGTLSRKMSGSVRLPHHVSDMMTATQRSLASGKGSNMLHTDNHRHTLTHNTTYCPPFRCRHCLNLNSKGSGVVVLRQMRPLLRQYLEAEGKSVEEAGKHFTSLLEMKRASICTWCLRIHRDVRSTRYANDPANAKSGEEGHDKGHSDVISQGLFLTFFWLPAVILLSPVFLIVYLMNLAKAYDAKKNSKRKVHPGQKYVIRTKSNVGETTQVMAQTRTDTYVRFQYDSVSEHFKVDQDISKSLEKHYVTLATRIDTLQELVGSMAKTMEEQPKVLKEAVLEEMKNMRNGDEDNMSVGGNSRRNSIKPPSHSRSPSVGSTKKYAFMEPRGKGRRNQSIVDIYSQPASPSSPVSLSPTPKSPTTPKTPTNKGKKTRKKSGNGKKSPYGR